MFSQKESNVWINMIDNNDSLVFIDLNNGFEVNALKMDFSIPNKGRNHSASICNKEGDLLFYISNYRIYNRFHQLTPHNFNHETLPPNDVNVQYFIVKRPGFDNQYFIIHCSSYRYPRNPVYISFSVLDMNLDDGKGDLISDLIDVPITNVDIDAVPSAISVAKGDCEKYWLMILGTDYLSFPTGNYEINAFQIDENGISNEPIVSDIGLSLLSTDVSDDMNFPQYTMAISHSYNAVVVKTKGLDLYTFNRFTGEVTDKRNIIESIGERPVFYERMIFDLREKLLYIPISQDNDQRGALYSLDISGGDIEVIRLSFKKLTDVVGEIVSPKIGPNNELYYQIVNGSTMNGKVSRLEWNGLNKYTIVNNLNKGSFLDIGNFPTNNSIWLSGDIFFPATYIDVCNVADNVTLSGRAEGEKFLWSNGDTNQSIVGTSGQTYWVQSTICDAIYHDTFIVQLLPETAWGIADIDSNVCAGSNISLSANGDSSSEYNWINDRGNVIGNSSKINYGVYYPQKIYLEEITINGCKFSDSVEFSTYTCCELQMPNSFSPNGDGLNDRFGIISESDKIIHSFFIFNRYGQLVFKANSINDSWDGTLLNKIAETGVYYYILRYSCYGNSDIQYIHRGDVILLR